MPLRPRPLVLFGRPLDPDARSLADVLRQETVGGALMLVAAVVAVVWANVDEHSYEAVRALHLGPLGLEHWAADGLLTIFFFVAGLELKRELTLGTLARPTEALVPVVAAVCGMAVPAAIYLLVNVATPGGQPDGWAIPMATDIAFALAILAVAAPGLPAALRAFLLTLAIVDDLGAILVIAVAFTAHVSGLWLLGAAGAAALWWALQWRHAFRWWLGVPLAVGCWICVWQGGIHPTIAGVTLGLLTPPASADRYEHVWRPVSAGVAVPIFALLSAGVVVDLPRLAGLVSQPYALGVVLGLVVGKTVGVFGGAFLTARFTRAELAADLHWRDVFAVAVLAGVGFTVALLIVDLAFAEQPAVRDAAKTAVLAGSLLAGLLGAVLLRLRLPRRAEQRHH